MQIQSWLSGFDGQYYIAQRLKRKPQILRKMHRFSVRLTQLQDIGGNRIIVDKNEDVESLRRYIHEKLVNNKDIKIHRETDYRTVGRDDTGYRALHIILETHKTKIELQIRSSAQHYWAECIERTSVIYGHYLKENDGDKRVIDYFKLLSHVFFEIESKREPTPQEKIDLDRKREESEKIIENKKNGKILHSHVNDDVIHTLTTIESKNPDSIKNWILIFDWNTGHFVNWESISRDPTEAYEAYSQNERLYEEETGFEVVLVGSSNVEMIRKTHSHYFGIDGYDSILEKLDQSILGFSSRQTIDAGSRRILLTLRRKNRWGKKAVSLDTLKNHYCQTVFGFDVALEKLLELGLVTKNGKRGPFSLNIRKQEEINSYL
ncbi:RelA/SpoT domain-containing protein [Marinobacterium sedimentorum]|uniref:RelA/SpoT domain-containing protein n=1 Tax=Marinobacterium sedimentorum TaxID=2927804 RepID=UPI0020C5DB88|nr:RelA/SpoT domain-containing protein [Marinobacterium sedimentorum]MCP8688099.1 RelA/SpoT domain-containing protein [Marinobacterium sedimentorum]